MIQIPLHFPDSFQESRQKIEKFFPPSSSYKSHQMPVIEKKFPKDFIQLVVCPFGPKYQYYICAKPLEEIRISKAVIHESQCYIQFYRTDEPGELLADLFVEVEEERKTCLALDKIFQTLEDKEDREREIFKRVWNKVHHLASY